MGYSPEEVEAAFHLYISRWREERIESAEAHVNGSKHIDISNTIFVVGSNDMALDLLVSLFRERSPAIEVEVAHAGSLGGLIALQEERAHLAGIHLLDDESGEYNYPYIKRILPGRELAVLHLVYRMQGLMFAAENPKQIRGLADLLRKDIKFINRQRGSGTRVLLDFKLRQMGVLSNKIKGYEDEVDSHLAVALAIKHGKADIGLGIEGAARSCEIDFLPLFRERYDLVITKESYQSRLFTPLLEIVTSKEYRDVVNQVGGYDTSQTGLTTFFN
jgi:putative molybdopterin biosynthesis protein